MTNEAYTYAQYIGNLATLAVDVANHETAHGLPGISGALIDDHHICPPSAAEMAELLPLLRAALAAVATPTHIPPAATAHPATTTTTPATARPGMADASPATSDATEADARRAKGLDAVNALLTAYPPDLHISTHDGLGAAHLHHARDGERGLTWIGRSCAAALAHIACDVPDVAIGQCAAEACGKYFVDQSRNRSRKFCSNTCASRTTVAAHRARKRS